MGEKVIGLKISTHIGIHQIYKTIIYGYSSHHKYLDVKKKIKSIRLKACFGVVPPKNQ